jgi:hypothetical protein
MMYDIFPCLMAVYTRMIFNYFTFMRQQYPMWFLQLLDAQTVHFALARDPIIQASYKQRPREQRDNFVDSLFDDRLVDTTISYRFISNDFPYFVQNGVLHYVLWVRSGAETDVSFIRNIISDHIIDKFHKPLEFYFYTNSRENKSIPEIDHFHVFINRYEEKRFFTFV